MTQKEVDTEVIRPEIGIDLIGVGIQTEGSRPPLGSSTTYEGIVLMALCLMLALTPLIFAVRLFEPYIAAKEVLIQSGTATSALLWILTARANSWALALTPAWIPLLVLALIGAGSLMWSSNPSVSLEQGQYFATYILLFAIALCAMRHAESRTALATVLVMAGSIEAVYVLLQYSFGDPIFFTGQLPGKWQTFGTLGNPNWTGEFLAVAALVSIGRLTDLSITTPSA